MHDVLIAGGGPSGMAAAIALAERGYAPVLVDQAGGIAAHRGELLAPGAREIMLRLGLGKALAGALPVDAVVSQWGRARMQAHGGMPGLGDHHGWGVDRRALSRAMLARATGLGVRVITARVGGQVRRGGVWHIATTGAAGGQALLARYAIDASGRRAIVARRHGARYLPDGDLVAAIWNAAPEQGASRMCAEAVADGWWYSVPYRGGRTVGLVTSAAQAQVIATAPEAALTAARDGLRLIRLQGMTAPPRLVDSRAAVLDRMTGAGWLATGDAAASFDPIASQGLFNALSGGFFAGNAVADVLAGDSDAADVYAALVARTAARTHAWTPLQYAAQPFDTSFWRDRSAMATLG